VYCEDNDVANVNVGQEFSSGVKPYSLDKHNAARLWAYSERITNSSFQCN